MLRYLSSSFFYLRFGFCCYFVIKISLALCSCVCGGVVCFFGCFFFKASSNKLNKPMTDQSGKNERKLDLNKPTVFQIVF